MCMSLCTVCAYYFSRLSPSFCLTSSAVWKKFRIRVSYLGSKSPRILSAGLWTATFGDVCNYSMCPSRQMNTQQYDRHNPTSHKNKLHHSAHLQCNSLIIYRNNNVCRCRRAAKHTVHIQRRSAVAGTFRTAQTPPSLPATHPCAVCVVRF